METMQIKMSETFEAASLVELSGELMQVELSDAQKLEVGSYVLCMFYGKEMYLRVLATSDKHAFLLTPYKQKDVFSDQRKTVRIATKLSGELSESSDSKPSQVKLFDFSHHGVGFTSPNESLKVGTLYDLKVTVDDNYPLKLTIQIQHKHQADSDDCRYGALIHSISVQDMRLLRSLVIREQLKESDAVNTEDLTVGI